MYLKPPGKTVAAELTEIDSLLGIGKKALPSNIYAALVGGNILGNFDPVWYFYFPISII